MRTSTSVDSTLNSASTLVVHDFVLAKNKNVTPKKIARYGQITTIVLMAVAVIWAPQISNFGGLWSYIQQAFSILVPPVAAIFLIGAFWRRGNGQGAFTALWLGHLIGLALFLMSQAGIWPVHFTINVGIMTIVSGIIFVVISLRSDAPDPEKVARTTWSPELLEPEAGASPVPWYGNVKLLTLLLCAGMLMVLIAFW